MGKSGGSAANAPLGSPLSMENTCNGVFPSWLDGDVPSVCIFFIFGRETVTALGTFGMSTRQNTTNMIHIVKYRIGSLRVNLNPISNLVYRSRKLHPKNPTNPLKEPSRGRARPTQADQAVPPIFSMRAPAWPGPTAASTICWTHCFYAVDKFVWRMGHRCAVNLQSTRRKLHGRGATE